MPVGCQVVVPRLVEVISKHDRSLYGYSGERDESDRDGNAEVVVQNPHEPGAAGQREPQREHYDQTFCRAAKVEMEKAGDDHEDDRHHETKPLRCTLHGFVLPGLEIVLSGGDTKERRSFEQRQIVAKGVYMEVPGPPRSGYQRLLIAPTTST